MSLCIIAYRNEMCSIDLDVASSLIFVKLLSFFVIVSFSGLPAFSN